MATHSNIIAWRIPQTLEPGELQSMGHERIRHVLATKLQQSMTKAPAVTSPHNATTEGTTPREQPPLAAAGKRQCTATKTYCNQKQIS